MSYTCLHVGVPIPALYPLQPGHLPCRVPSSPNLSSPTSKPWLELFLRLGCFSSSFLPGFASLLLESMQHTSSRKSS